MKTKKYVLLFILNSFLWLLLCFSTEIISPSSPNPKGIWDLNMTGFIVGLGMFFGVYLIPFYLLCIKKISDRKIQFFLLNFLMIIIFNPLVWMTINNILTTEVTLSGQFSREFLLIYLVHISIFIIIYSIKQLYYKKRVTH